jgi:hypothetical protein
MGEKPAKPKGKRLGGRAKGTPNKATAFRQQRIAEIRCTRDDQKTDKPAATMPLHKPSIDICLSRSSSYTAK